MYLPFGMQAGNTNHIYKLAQQVGQRDAPPVGGFEVSFVSKFGGFVSRSLAAPPYRNVRLNEAAFFSFVIKEGN